jgi:tripartite-type tricarboxylate transporter receptor subunit TctC
MKHPIAAMVAALALATGLAAAPASAQPYPSKPVRVIVQFPPGGTPDIYGRIMATELGKLWNQSVVVENRAGASGSIGTEAVVKSPPDGYTLLFSADAPIVINPHLYTKMAYDPLKDLVPIVNVAAGGFVLLAHPSAPFNNVRELIAHAKANPGKVSYASSGAGSSQHLSMELIRTSANLELIHVPYKGFGQGLADVIAGQVPMIFGGATASLGIMRSGKLKPIGITTANRIPALADVPAIAETIPGVEINAWYGFMGPAGMPRDLVRKINADVVSIVKRPDFLERLARDAIEPVATTPEEFAAQIRADLAKFEKIVKASGARGE